MLLRCILILLLAGCMEEDELHVSAEVRMTLVGDDLAATNLELEADAWEVIDVYPSPISDPPRMSLDVRMEVDGEIVRLPQTTGTGSYGAAPRTGFPDQITLLAQGAELALELVDPFSVSSAPIEAGFRLSFSPPQGAGESILVSFSTESQASALVRGAGEGATYVDVPSDARNVRMTRLTGTAGSEDADTILSGTVRVIREQLQL